jgi:hypothetical protein
LIDKLLGGVTPYLLGALAIAGVVIWGLWGRLDAAEVRAEAAANALKESEKSLSIMRAQHIAASAVAEALRDEREKDRAAARLNVGKTLNAPITENAVVPGALPAAIGGLRNSAGH